MCIICIKMKKKRSQCCFSFSGRAVYPSSSLRLLTTHQRDGREKHRIIKMFNYLRGFVLRQDDYRTMHYVSPLTSIGYFSRSGQRHFHQMRTVFFLHNLVILCFVCRNISLFQLRNINGNYLPFGCLCRDSKSNRAAN